MGELELYAVTAKFDLGRGITYTQFIGLSPAKSKPEAIALHAAEIDEWALPINVEYDAQPVRVEGFKITLSPLEKKVSPS